MPFDPYSRVSPGQDMRISAVAWNDLMDMLRWFKGSRSESSGARGSANQRIEVSIRNDSGSDVPRFGILGIDDSGFDPDDSLMRWKNEIYLAGITPDVGSHWGNFAVALQPLADGDIGRALLVGCTPCKLHVHQESHQWADVNDGELDTLATDDCGLARIVWKQAGTGDKWGIVSLGCPNFNGFGVAQEDITPNTTGLFKFSNRGGGTTWGNDVSGIWPAATDAGTISSGKVVFRARIGGEWILSPVECPA